MEHFDALSDDSLLHVVEPELLPVISGPNLTHELFLYDRYDWTNFDPPYAVVHATRGYFGIVDEEDYDRVIGRKWQANVQVEPRTGRIRKVYLYRNLSGKGTSKSEYLHRLVVGAGAKVVIDHWNGLSPDCRKCNLVGTTQLHNLGNRISNGRKKNTELKRGVELRMGGTMYGAQIKLKGKTTHSKEVWPLTSEGEEAAHQWYLAEHKKAFSHRGLVQNGGRVILPLFPPLKTAVVVPSRTFCQAAEELRAPF